MKNDDFKEDLKVDALTNNNFSLNKTNSILSELGLLPLPENVQAEISNDNKYLNLKIKDFGDEKHLLFQFPLIENDLSALKNRVDYQDLMDRYHLYTNDYVDEIKKYAIQERKYLHKKFPNLIFNIKIRIKSPMSYSRKLNENILNGKDPYINDIIAERIILSGYTDNNDKYALLKEKYANNPKALSKIYVEEEKELKQMCDEIAKALYEFRINTNFRMKKDIEPNEANSEKEYITKDYIQHPKKNGYESIHILMEHKDNKDFTYETQIRTLQMESMSKTSGEIAHNKYKPRLLNDLSSNRVPIYSEVTPFADVSGKPEIFDIPFENRFYHFYNSEHADHSHLDKQAVSVTYKKFREEQYALENLLGVQFKEIRQRLKGLNLDNIKEQSVR